VYINTIYTQFTGHIHFSTKYIPVLAAKKKEKKDIFVVKKMKSKKQNIEEISKQKRTLIGTFLIISILIGIITSAISVAKFENYIHPYAFGFTFGGIGLFVGLFVFQKYMPPFKKINPKARIEDIIFVAIMFSFGFIGSFMFLGQFLNHSTSKLEKCDNFAVVDKFYRKAKGRIGELNILYINIDGQVQKMSCKRHTYWERISIGQRISVCVYNSRIGFDYLELPNEK